MSITKAGIELMFVRGLNGRPTKCTIKGRYYTSVFRFPKAFLQAETNIDPVQIAAQGQFIATMVSDLQSYFQEHSPFSHYSISLPFRHEVEKIVQKKTKGSREDVLPLFIVIEQEISCETIMDDGTCFIVDGNYFQGGSSEEAVIVAAKASDCAWPEEKEEVNQFVNIILAAVKVEQNMTSHIEELFSTSCFFDINEHAIYPSESMISSVPLSIESPIDNKNLKEKSDRLQKLVNGFEMDMKENMRTACRIITSLRLGKSKDDYYRRTWYLRLYEAMLDKLTSGPKKEFRKRHKKKQVKISHPAVSGTVDMEDFNYLQTDVLAELRRIYLESNET